MDKFAHLPDAHAEPVRVSGLEVNSFTNDRFTYTYPPTTFGAPNRNVVLKMDVSALSFKGVRDAGCGILSGVERKAMDYEAVGQADWRPGRRVPHHKHSAAVILVYTKVFVRLEGQKPAHATQNPREDMHP
ncbi:hypothetical protein EXIGLDRAFT_833555 [Exidia glandulosa HHB12029]|uniref:Uncharacterized protein n=1 Tax=Exidia glandulosa HHB12029 TaxID=1314781 RepID=A0A165KJZ7_EXIGL|nr:hypothetical protein EXIGLDRAFT_833555 [Exidia glandulosa HHB12029]